MPFTQKQSLCGSLEMKIRITARGSSFFRLEYPYHGYRTRIADPKTETGSEAWKSEPGVGPENQIRDQKLNRKLVPESGN